MTLSANDLEQMIVGCSPIIQRLRERVLRIGPTRTPVLLHGASGVGKEVVARALHAASGRRGQFVPANVNAFQDTLFESEMFGHVRGAFSGAVRDREGMLRRANHGTAFLDEIGDLPAPLQAKLLRAVETGEVWPVGSDHKFNSDFRLIAATNVNLLQSVRTGRFRLDLFYRLGGRVLEIAPLNERMDDVPLLVDHLLARVAPDYAHTHGSISACAMSFLKRRSWPGNVRQLQNVLESAVTEAAGGEVTECHVREVLVDNDASPLGVDKGSGEDEQLRARLLDLITAHDGDAAAVAASIGVSRATIYRYMQKLGVRTGKRKVWKLLDEQPVRDGATTRTNVSDFSPVNETFLRQVRLSESGESTSNERSMS